MISVLRILLSLLFAFIYFISSLFAQQLDTTLHRQVDVIPQFTGGVKAWNTFVSKTIDLGKIMESIDEETYMKYGMIQRATVEFTVCEDGKVCDVVVLNADKISPEFTEEVLRLMSKSPKWKPATLRGQKVRTRFKQPITISLKE